MPEGSNRDLNVTETFSSLLKLFLSCQDCVGAFANCQDYFLTNFNTFQTIQFRQRRRRRKTNLITQRLLFGALDQRLRKLDESGVFRFFQAAMNAIFHHRNELLVAQLAVLIVVENGENDAHHVIAQIDVRHRFGHVLQRCLIDRGARNVIEHQCGVHVVNVAQKPEKVQIILPGDALGRLEPVGTRVTSPVGPPF